jgi:hypothetical protein
MRLIVYMSSNILRSSSLLEVIDSLGAMSRLWVCQQ